MNCLDCHFECVGPFVYAKVLLDKSGQLFMVMNRFETVYVCKECKRHWVLDSLCGVCGGERFTNKKDCITICSNRGNWEAYELGGGCH